MKYDSSNTFSLKLEVSKNLYIYSTSKNKSVDITVHRKFVVVQK